MGNAKLFGGLGSLFIVLGFIPYIGTILGLVGFILLLVAVKQLSDYYREPELFSKFIKGVIVYIAGFIVGALVGAGSFFALAEGHGSLGAYIFAFIAFVIIYASGVVGSYYIKEVFQRIALLTVNNLFDWAGKLIFVGAILTIVLVGALISWAGWIILTVAFFTIEENNAGRVEDGGNQGNS
ncbi:DUF996 domain-containing protein [Thermovibrio sp.]